MSHHRIRVRKAQFSEREAIVDFFDENLHNMYHDPGFVPAGLIFDKIKRGNVFVCEVDNKMVGVAITNGKTLWNFVIHKNFRKQRIGSAFLKELNPQQIRIKAKGGIPDPTGFYSKNGYKPVEFVSSGVTNKKTILLAAKATA